MLAPQPGGVLAALDAAPEADVLLVAHTGLDHLSPSRDIWRCAADGQADHHALVAGPAREIPAGREDQIEWLFDWWEHVDDWIEEHRPRGAPAEEARQEIFFSGMRRPAELPS